jgi:hypothetical protein
MSAPQEPSFILHPDRDVPRGDWDELPVYELTSRGGVGPLKQGALMVFSFSFATFDPARWDFLPDQRAVIAAPGGIGTGGGFWMERALLAEPGYAGTTAQIDAEAFAMEQRLKESFWKERRAEILAMKEITIRNEMPGAIPNNIITVRPGTYAREPRLLEKRLLESQLSPFCVFIWVDGVKVAIIPDALWGTSDEAAEAAQAKGLGKPLTANAIRDVFAAAPPLVRDHLPATAWLTDAQIHYVTPGEMGAVCVLERLPASADEISAAATEHPADYNAGMGTAGVRFGDHIFIEQAYQGTGTEYHEALHKLSHRAMRDVLGKWFNEGATEYLTWKVIQPLADAGKVIRDDDQYGPQRTAIETLIPGAFSAAELAAAYFQGQLQPLYDGFARATGRQLSLDGYAARLSAVTAAAAVNVATGAFSQKG